MTRAQAGFLLLCSHLGDAGRRVLTDLQMDSLTCALRGIHRPEGNPTLTWQDLKGLGMEERFSRQVAELLSQEDLLEEYLRRGNDAGCVPVCRGDSRYPVLLRQRLGGEAPGCLWAKGDLSLLDAPAISVVGNRVISPGNYHFATQVGKQAARSGCVLISGNAHGADSAAQTAAMDAGGRVISVVADSLMDKSPRRGVLYLSQGDFDAPFSGPRALSRNRVIHALGERCFVAQCSRMKGGTWSGTCRNLREGWCPVYVYQDGSEGCQELVKLGAVPVETEDICML